MFSCAHTHARTHTVWNSQGETWHVEASWHCNAFFLWNPYSLKTTSQPAWDHQFAPTSECCLLISAVFNTISPIKLIKRLNMLGLSMTLCSWILNFLTNTPQTVGINHHSFTPLVLNTEATHGVFSHILFSLYTQNWNPDHGVNSAVKFANHTTINNQIFNND